MDKRYGESLDDWNNPGPKAHHKSETADVLYSEANRLYEKKRYSEAITLVNVAIENSSDNYQYHVLRAKILEGLDRYSQSIQAYDMALDISDGDEALEGKAETLYKWANSLNDKKKALELIDEAILICPDSSKDRYFEKFWYLKGSIYDCLEMPVESRRCYLMAEGMSDEIRELDSQVDFLKNTKDTLINITGTRFYFGPEVFGKGQIVDLVKEDDNEHDGDAIRVEIEGETVGYVANSEYTLIENVKSASEIRKMNPKSAQVVLIYLDEYVIAKLID